MSEKDELRRWSVGDHLTVDLDDRSVAFADGTRSSFDGDYGCGLLPEEKVREVPLGQLDAALGAIVEDVDAEDDYDWPIETWLVETDPPIRKYELEYVEGVYLYTFGVGELCALIDFEDLHRGADPEFEDRVPGALAAMTGRLGARFQAPFTTQIDGQQVVVDASTYVVMVEFESKSGRTAGDLIDLAADARALLLALRYGDVDQKVAGDLLRAGHSGSVVGQLESQWLEAKSQPWGLTTPEGKAEAVKDVSALANAGGGIVVIPATTAKDGKTETVTEIKSMPLDRFSEVQLRDVIADWTFPPLRKVDVDVVEVTEGRGYIVISVPACKADAWPHLIVQDPSAAFPSHAVSAYVRDGDKNRALPAAELHHLIRAGHVDGS